jgi:hypothetical protein
MNQMNAFDILKAWPGISEASAEELFAHPAWAMPCQWGDEKCVLRRAAAKPRDVIGLAIALDDDAHFLGLGNREAFPDLHDLWARKADLPPALVLALVEKECGDLLQLIENVVRRQVRVIGLDDPAKRAGALAFDVVSLADGSIKSTFVFDVRPSTVRMFGQLRFLDVSHESVRTMERPVRAVYSVFDLQESDVAGLAAGDYLMLPELEAGVAGEWRCSIPADGRVRVVSADETMVTFASIVDDALPSLPAPSALELHLGQKVVARGRFGALCSKPAFVIEEVL